MAKNYSFSDYKYDYVAFLELCGLDLCGDSPFVRRAAGVFEEHVLPLLLDIAAAGPQPRGRWLGGLNSPDNADSAGGVSTSE